MSFVPLHTRTILLRVRWSCPTEVIAEGRLIDLRKRAIVPLGATLRGPGLVHDMSVRVRVDLSRPGTLTIAAVDTVMDAFPYVGSDHTGGEWCAGRMQDVQSAVGLDLAAASCAEALGAAIGGPRGCFHVFTLLRICGPALVAALRAPHLRARFAETPMPAPGEILWSRCISVDALKLEGLTIRLHGTLTDAFQRGGPPGASAEPERLEGGVEVMADFSTAFPAALLKDVAGRRRALRAGLHSSEPWQEVPEYAALQEVGVHKGFSARVGEILDDPQGLRPESHLILMMAPVVMQSVPSLLEDLDVRRPGKGGRSAAGSAVDSCHMWRADGPLDRLTRGEAGPNPK